MEESRRAHWDRVFATKSSEEVSWTQEIPRTSLDMIRSAGLDKSAKIIDIGGGDSRLVDYLLDEGFLNVTVLDISAEALEKAKTRLGKRASNVHWIVSDILNFQPTQAYDLWHDRAAFHFLTQPDQIEAYKGLVNQFVEGHLVLGTFAETGPKKCSGLEIRQYSEESMESIWRESFEKLECIQEKHTTPFDTSQDFTFCHFLRK